MERYRGYLLKPGGSTRPPSRADLSRFSPDCLHRVAMLCLGEPRLFPLRSAIPATRVVLRTGPSVERPWAIVATTTLECLQDLKQPLAGPRAGRGGWVRESAAAPDRWMMA